jgi:hypothetical protein
VARITLPVVDATGEENRDEEAYTATSNTLQTLVIIFLGFILFFSYVLIPYYFMGDKYESEKNIVYFLPMMSDNFSFIKDTFRNFSSNDNNYRGNITSLNAEAFDYFTKINGTKQLYDKYSNGIATPKAKLRLMIEGNTSSLKTYPFCYLTNSNFSAWAKCNSAFHIEDSKKDRFVVLDNKTRKAIDGKIDNVQNLVFSIRLYNDKADIINASDLRKWDNITDNLLNRSSNTEKINYLVLENYMNPNYYAMPSKSPKDRQNLTADIENQIKTYSSKLESLEYPIVGKVPVLNINGAFLSFPFLIAIGFSFLSLQFKKLIKIRKDLKWDNKKEEDRILMSWIDPLQPFPEKIYPLIIIIVPSILFVIFLFFIHSLWYDNDPYLHGSIAGDLLWIPNYFKVIFYISVMLGGAIFGFSYLEIIKAWRNRRKSDSHKSLDPLNLHPT